VQRICDRYITCKQGKSKVMPYELYTPLIVPTKPWVDVSLDYILSLPSSRKARDSIFVVVDRFFKMINSISCHKADDVIDITNLFYRKVVWLHGVPMSIMSDRNEKFLSYF
jgi:hypothetical protein